MGFQLKALSLSYKHAPLTIRETVALSEDESAQFIFQIKELIGISEALILSTCNRTEIYYSAEKDFTKEILGLLRLFKKLPSQTDLSSYFEKIDNEAIASRHLFRVSIGLESQVVGDIQITNQVKRAYQISADADMAGPILHRMMHTVFYTNKRVVQETPFKDGAASVSYAAVELIRDLTLNIIDPQVLLIGVGEIGTDVARNLRDADFKNVNIINRTFEKSKELAGECGFEALKFEELHDLVENSDVIISTVGGGKPIIEYNWIKNIEIPGYKHFIDLSVPRSIEKEVDQVNGASLYNIDSIQAKTNETLNKRLSSIPHVERIIEEAIEEFKDWTKEMAVSPAIKEFKNALEDIRKEEMAKYLKNLDPKQAKMLEQITKSMMQKIVKLPALNLKAACRRDDADSLVDGLNELFNLELQKEQQRNYEK
jgi:glutamyl-tRNA reductase